MKSDYEKKDNRIRNFKKGISHGYCRICGKYAHLTLDHIPPHSCGNDNKVTVRTYNDKNISQNGFACKTICDSCNNNLLGANYDKEFKKLYDSVKDFHIAPDINTGLYIPIQVTEINWRSLVRGMLGHLLAVTVVNNNETIQDALKMPINDMTKYFPAYRDFVLGKQDTLVDFDIYYWYYPCSNIIISTWASYVFNFASDNQVTFNGLLIKYYPLSLFIVEKNNKKLKLPVVDFESNKIRIDHCSITDPDFPENPKGMSLVLTANDSIIGAERNPIGKINA